MFMLLLPIFTDLMVTRHMQIKKGGAVLHRNKDAFHNATHLGYTSISHLHVQAYMSHLQLDVMII
jgi:hypothetical protein